MLGKTHLVFALFLSTFFVDPYAWVVVLVSSILPDIDTKTSLLGRKMKLIGSVFTHRGFFHSFFFFIPTTILIASFSSLLAIAFAAGFGGHLLLDMLTSQGLRLYPFKKRIKGFIKVGSFVETSLRFLLFSLFIIRLWL